MRKNFLLGVLFSLAASARAAEPARPVVLKAAHLFDGRGDAAVSPGVVIVEGGRIAALGAGAAVPAGAEVIDLGDATLLPGFIDAHTHLTGEMGPNWFHDFYDRLMRFPAEQAHHAAAYARRVLDAGFTTVRDVGSGDLLDVGLRNAINAGLVPGPRMLVAVHALGATGGHGDGTPYPPDRVKTSGPIDGVCNGERGEPLERVPGLAERRRLLVAGRRDLDAVLVQEQHEALRAVCHVQLRVRARRRRPAGGEEDDGAQGEQPGHAQGG